MVRYKWIHRMVRKFMQPVEFEEAEKWCVFPSIFFFGEL